MPRGAVHAKDELAEVVCGFQGTQGCDGFRNGVDAIDDGAQDCGLEGSIHLREHGLAAHEDAGKVDGAHEYRHKVCADSV